MKRAILAAAILGLASFQSAKAIVINFDDPAYPAAPAGVTFSFSGTNEVVQGNAFNDYDAPFYADGTADTTQYLAVRGGETATFTFSAPQSSLTLLWGSIDNFNTINFFLGTTPEGMVTGAQFNPTGATGAAASKTVSLDFTFDSFTLGGSQNSFEADNLTTTAVPEPSTWAMLALGAGGLLAGVLRRRGASIV